jgi:predicted nucleic acid-binding protein
MDELVIDSSVFIAAFKIGDPFHDQALQILEQVGTRYRAHVSTLVPVEVVGAIARTVGQEEAEKVRKKFAEWVSAGFLSLQDLNRRRVEQAQQIAIKYRLRGADAVIAQLAYEKKARLATFDEELLRFEERKLENAVGF